MGQLKSFIRVANSVSMKTKWTTNFTSVKNYVTIANSNKKRRSEALVKAVEIQDERRSEQRLEEILDRANVVKNHLNFCPDINLECGCRGAHSCGEEFVNSFDSSCGCYLYICDTHAKYPCALTVFPYLVIDGTLQKIGSASGVIPTRLMKATVRFFWDKGFALEYKLEEGEPGHVNGYSILPLQLTSVYP